MPSILFIKSGTANWYMEVHIEYLIRYLGAEFFIEQADIPYPPYPDFLQRFPETSPLERSPDDYDLLIPELGTHPHVSVADYKHKLGVVSWEGMQGYVDGAAVYGATNPQSEDAYAQAGVACHALRIGIDTDLFAPWPIRDTSGCLRVGLIGSIGNPRHRILDIYQALKDLPGIQLMIFPSFWANTAQDILQYGDTVSKEPIDTQDFIRHIAGGQKRWVGVPNCYNQMDVLVRVEQDEEYGFPVLEAAACGVPVIATPWGNCQAVLDAGGGITIPTDISLAEQLAQTVEAVNWFKTNWSGGIDMALAALREAKENWTWEQHLPNWRTFFQEGVDHAHATT